MQLFPFRASRSSPPKVRQAPRWIALGILLIGLLLCAYLARQALDSVAAKAQREREFDSREAQLQIEARLGAVEQALLSGVALFDASDSVARQALQQFSQRLQSGPQLHGVQGLGYAPLTTDAALPRLIAGVQSEGFPAYAVRPAGRRDLYAPIVFLEPLDTRNQRAIGYDMYSDPSRRAAMDQARDENAAALSGRVDLKQEYGATPQAGTLMYRPVYRRHAPIETLAQRREAITGWIYSPLRMGELMQSTLQDWEKRVGEHLQVKVYDGWFGEADKLLYASPPGAAAPTPSAQNEALLRLVHFHGSTWRLQFESLDPPATLLNQPVVSASLAGGALVSLLLSLLALAYLKTRQQTPLSPQEPPRALRERDPPRALNGTEGTAQQPLETGFATERRGRRWAREKDHRWLRLQSAALQACPHAVLIIEVNGAIHWVNRAFTALTGYEAAEARGRTLRDLVKSGKQDQEYYAALWQTVLTGKPWKGELSNRRKNGDLYHEEMSITPVHNEQGAITHFVAVKQDITEHKQIVEEANAANNTKSAFLANMSHEIRTPLNGVIGMAELLQATRLEPAQRSLLDGITNSALVLLGLLTDILDFSMVEAKQLRIDHRPVQLRELLAAVLQSIEFSARDKSAALQLVVSPALPEAIFSDSTRLRQMLVHLLSNAIKFNGSWDGQTAQVALHVEPCTLPSGRAGITFRVIDNGIGMTQDIQDALFQAFTQADETSTRQFGGAGLGLIISKRLVELMGGTIAVKSAPGVGTEVALVLPLEPAPAPARARSPV